MVIGLPSARLFGHASQMKIDPNINYYATIGLQNNACEDEIKSNYYALAKKYHPDSTEGLSFSSKREFEDKFKSVTAAYEILSDPDKKRSYDDLIAL